MRVLFVSNGFPPFSNYGTESYTHSLAHTLAESGHDVHVFFPIHGHSAAYTPQRGTDGAVTYTAVVQSTAPFWDFRQYYANPSVIPLFLDVVAAFRPDIVHCTYVLMGLTADLIPITKQLGIPVVVTLTDAHFLCQRGQLLDTHNALCPGPEGGARCERVCFPDVRGDALSSDAPIAAIWSHDYDTVSPFALRDRYLRQILREADAIIAPTAWLRAAFSAWGIPETQMALAEFGVDDRILRTHRHRPSSRLRVAFIGQIAPHKGTHTLIAAFAAADAPDMELNIYGNTEDPTARALLAGVGEAKADPRIRFRGTFPPNQLGQVFSDIDLLVVPSEWHENSPLVLRNAVLTATPVLISNLDGMTPYVHEGGNGLTFVAGDADDLRRVLQQIADAPEMLTAFRAHRVTTTTIAEDAARLVAIYRDLARPHTSRDNVS